MTFSFNDIDTIISWLANEHNDGAMQASFSEEELEAGKHYDAAHEWWDSMLPRERAKYARLALGEPVDPENIYNLPGIRQSVEEDRK